MNNIGSLYNFVFNPTHTNYFRHSIFSYVNDKIVFNMNNIPIKQTNEFKIILIMIRNRLFRVDKVNLNVIRLFSKFIFGYILLKFICFVYKLTTRKELEY